MADDKERSPQELERLRGILSESLVGVTSLTSLEATLRDAITDGIIDQKEAADIYEYHSMRLEYDTLDDATKQYLEDYTSSDDLLNRITRLGLDPAISGNIYNYVLYGVGKEALDIRTRQAEYNKNVRRQNLAAELPSITDLGQLRTTLNQAVANDTISADEASQYLTSYQEQMGTYQQGFQAQLQGIQNNPYLTQEDINQAYAKYMPQVSGEAERYATQFRGLGVPGVTTIPQTMTPENRQMMVSELNTLAANRQRQAEEEERLNIAVGAVGRTPVVAQERVRAPEAGSLIERARGRYTTYAPGSRLQQYIEGRTGELINQGMRERQQYYNVNAPATYEQALAGYQGKLAEYQNLAQNPLVAERATAEAKRTQDIINNLNPYMTEQAANWYTQYMAPENDPLYKKLFGQNLQAQYRGLTASQRGQNVARFRPSLRF